MSPAELIDETAEYVRSTATGRPIGEKRHRFTDDARGNAEALLEIEEKYDLKISFK
jgi:hypothetical protein